MLKKAFAIAALLVLSATGAAQAQDYPPATNSLTVDDSTPAAGQTIVLNARTFVGNVSFTLNSDPVHLGSAIANPQGVASLTVKLPANTTSGAHTIVANGLGTNGQALSVSTGITVSGGTSGIPRTGSNDTVPFATAGVAALALGGLLLLGAKRRHAKQADATV